MQGHPEAGIEPLEIRHTPYDVFTLAGMGLATSIYGICLYLLEQAAVPLWGPTGVGTVCIGLLLWADRTRICLDRHGGRGEVVGKNVFRTRREYFDLDDVVAVDLETPIGRYRRARGIIRLRDGTRIPLTNTLSLEVGFHERLAAEVREYLGLSK